MKRIIASDGGSQARREMLQYPLAQDMQSICKNYGYELYYAYVDSGILQLSVYAIDRKSYHPEVYIQPDWGSTEVKYRIQTTSYGSIDLEEYYDFLESCNDAYNMCQELQQLIESNSLDENEILHRVRD